MQSRNVRPVFDTGTDVITGRKQKFRRCVQKGTSPLDCLPAPIALRGSATSAPRLRIDLPFGLGGFSMADSPMNGMALQFSEAHNAFAIERLMICEMLAERPMLVEQRHAGRGIGIQHLLCGDDLDLVRVDLEPQFRSRNLLAGIVDTLQLLELPVRSLKIGIRLSRSWRGFLLLAAALKEVVKHRKDLAAVADLAHRQRRSIGAQTLIQRPKR